MEEKLNKEAEYMLNYLKRTYGFNKADFDKWIPKGGDILNYIGLQVIYVDFNRDENGNWTNKTYRAIINNISDFENLSSTYLVNYTLFRDEDKEPEIKEDRIYPVGISFSNPDETGKMFRLVPMSLHCKAVETEELYGRLSILMAKKETLSIKELTTISESKNMDEILDYSHNIVAIMKTIDNEILYFRVNKLDLRHTHKDKYKLTLYDKDKKSINLNISQEDKIYEFIYRKEKLAEVKVIDLGN